MVVAYLRTLTTVRVVVTATMEKMDMAHMLETVAQVRGLVPENSEKLTESYMEEVAAVVVICRHSPPLFLPVALEVAALGRGMGQVLRCSKPPVLGALTPVAAVVV